MKKALLGLFFLVLVSFTALAQEKGEARIHAFGTYGLRNDQFGYGGGVEYFFADKFALMPSFTWIKPEVGNLSNFSFDLRYYFTEGVSQVYVLAGYSQTFENTQPGSPGTRRNLVGGNFGAGAYIRITDWVGFVSEFRFQSQGIQQVVAKAGLAFPL
ncbi:MAG: hypothetical protein EP311_10860 [Cytophagales bacterium]|uniref:Outer membrane protein beta-barrel domain-containing protein n=1 Tax=Algoriphagus taiwanensis TaxID=1445656 RepID=A0ABQ6PV59_9BACT|nr:MAG: hypothetical protein EP311_10860 [Cytophagales bacterium]GMQ26409.1 hypothetical protein Aoki45_30910 [Algoriphagus sp. oki45]GMQ31850.1 hypothetical protein Ataiwa_01220 [Algoriphagus taiwanensis]